MPASVHRWAMCAGLAALLVALLLPAAAPAAPRLHPKWSPAPNEAWAAVARGLATDHYDGYTLTLVGPTLAGRSLPCRSTITNGQPARDGRLGFSGIFPGSLRCDQTDDQPERVLRVKVGAVYHVVLTRGPGQELEGELLRVPVRVVASGRACREPRFRVDERYNSVTILRARRVRCTRARAMVRAGRWRARRCLGHRRCSFRARGFRCSSVGWATGIVLRCTRRRARITYFFR